MGFGNRVMCFAFLTNWLGWGPMSVQNDPHNYIHGVLQRNDHGPYRRISCDLTTLNDAIQQHAERIGAPLLKMTIDIHLPNCSQPKGLRLTSNEPTAEILTRLLSKIISETYPLRPFYGLPATSTNSCN